MRNTAVVAMSVVLFSAGTARAQAVAIGHTIEPEQSAVHVTGLGGLTDDATLVGVTGGYSFRGLVDVSLVVTDYLYDESAQAVFGDDITSLVIGPSLAVHVLRQGIESPVSVMVLGDFQYLHFASDALDDAGVDIRGWGVSLGGAVYRRIATASNWTIVPWGGISLTRGTLTIDTPDGSDSDSDTDAYLQLHGTFVYRPAGASVGWTIDPFIAIADNEIIGVYVGALFGG